MDRRNKQIQTKLHATMNFVYDKSIYFSKKDVNAVQKKNLVGIIRLVSYDLSGLGNDAGQI